MVSCCSINPYTEFEVIIIGAGVPEISLAFHLTSYGIKTALVDEQNMDHRLKFFLKTFQDWIERDSGMPWTLQELKEDIHLILFEGDITIQNEQVICIDEHEIQGDRMVIKFDTFKKIGKPEHQNGIHFKNDAFKMVTSRLWITNPSLAEADHQEIWRAGEHFSKQLQNIE
jgi:hypothetical protein